MFFSTQTNNNIVFDLFSTRNIQGEITVNGSPRELKKFYTQSAYIMQDTELQQFLTVMEAMHFSVNLKVGDQLGRSAKKERVSFC